jgi:hypothetical protein
MTDYAVRTRIGKRISLGAHHDLETPSYTPTDLFTCTLGDVRRRYSRNTANTDARDDSTCIDLSQTVRASVSDGGKDLAMVEHQGVFEFQCAHRSDAKDEGEEKKRAYTSNFGCGSREVNNAKRKGDWKASKNALT